MSKERFAEGFKQETARQALKTPGQGTIVATISGNFSLTLFLLAQ